MKRESFEGNRFYRFIGYLIDNPVACEVAAQLQRQGVDLHKDVFTLLLRYIDPEDAAEIVEGRRKRHKQDSAIFNLGVRRNGVAPEVGRWLIARSELARSTTGFGHAHSIDYLVVMHVTLEAKTRRKVTASELAYLVEAANYATGRRPLSVEPNTITQELLRHRKAHPNFIPLLKSKISSAR